MNNHQGALKIAAHAFPRPVRFYLTLVTNTHNTQEVSDILWGKFEVQSHLLLTTQLVGFYCPHYTDDGIWGDKIPAWHTDTHRATPGAVCAFACSLSLLCFVWRGFFLVPGLKALFTVSSLECRPDLVPVQASEGLPNREGTEGGRATADFRHWLCHGS